MESESKELTQEEQDFLAKLALVGIVSLSAIGAYSGYKIYTKVADRLEQKAREKQTPLMLENPKNRLL
jgi:hypothetical protein